MHFFQAYTQQMPDDYSKAQTFSLIGYLPLTTNVYICKLACLYNPFCDLYRYMQSTKHCYLMAFNSTMWRFRNLTETIVDSFSIQKKHINGILFTDGKIVIFLQFRISGFLFSKICSNSRPPELGCWHWKRNWHIEFDEHVELRIWVIVSVGLFNIHEIRYALDNLQEIRS